MAPIVDNASIEYRVRFPNGWKIENGVGTEIAQKGVQDLWLAGP